MKLLRLPTRVLVPARSINPLNRIAGPNPKHPDQNKHSSAQHETVWGSNVARRTQTQSQEQPVWMTPGVSLFHASGILEGSSALRPYTWDERAWTSHIKYTHKHPMLRAGQSEIIFERPTPSDPAQIPFWAKGEVVLNVSTHTLQVC
jgi:hypothetical protein